MKLATSIGISISEFWEITPYELNVCANSYFENKKLEYKDSILQAYFISRFVWQKKVDIEKILDFEKKEETMTDDEMERQAMILNKLFGGEVKTIGKE